MTWAQVCARRLERHALLAPAQGAQIADIVAAMCGAHAQVLSAAELSIGLRVGGITRADVREALWTERSLVKTFGPRGTVHLLPAQDLPMWIGALSAIPHAPSPFPKDTQLTPEQTDAVVEAISAALEDAALTIDELTEAIVASAGPWAGDLVMPAFNGMWPRWRQAVDTAANCGVLCFGPNRGRNITYTSPRHWLPGFRPADGATALADLVRRYLYAYGPATPQQFAQWLAAPRQWATELFDILAGELQQVEVGGAIAWVTSGIPRLHPRRPRACGCCPTSMPMWWAATRASYSSPAERQNAPWPAVKAAISRCCCSMVSSPESGTSAAPAGRSRLRSSRWKNSAPCSAAPSTTRWSVLGRSSKANLS
jgi:DNA glycosylase AlkZ-like